LVQWADVVIEASRPRALAQLGVDVTEIMRSPLGTPRVWISITGHGRTPAPDRVAFGDDAAAGGGLVVWDGGSPRFCADAVADPLSGLRAARACLDALGEGGRWMLDVSMAHVSAELAGPTLEVPEGTPVAEPRARRTGRVAPAPGAHTAEVLAELGLRGG
jgi:crotonobetainyl-CoA:carnitine CoA-transferase CaiB-like acyl-CoA transferase